MLLSDEGDGTFSTFDGSTSQYLFITEPLSINLDGDTTGYYYTSTSAFVRERNGTITTFDASGGTGVTFPAAINLSGTITGYVYAGDIAHGFLRLEKK